MGRDHRVELVWISTRSRNEKPAYHLLPGDCTRLVQSNSVLTALSEAERIGAEMCYYCAKAGGA